MSPTSDQILRERLSSGSASTDENTTFSAWVSHVQTQLAGSQLPTSQELLDSIPVLAPSSHLSLAALTWLLTQTPSILSPFDVIRCYNKLWISLPEEKKSGHDIEAAQIIQEALRQVKIFLPDLPSHFILQSHRPALFEPEERQHLSHAQLSTFISNFKLPVTSLAKNTKPVVAIALSNGPLLGLACLAVASYYTAVPLNIGGGANPLKNDLHACSANAILVLEPDVVRLGLNEPWVAEAGLRVLVVQPQVDMSFNVRSLTDVPAGTLYQPIPNSGDDMAFLLFTSGTSGTKKMVPITCFSLLNGVSCVIDSWGLTVQDSCINMMPLNHVGGLVRNLFAPILSGGSTILCPAFDANQFWDIVQESHGTWYYASPSMVSPTSILWGAESAAPKPRCHEGSS